MNKGIGLLICTTLSIIAATGLTVVAHKIDIEEKQRLESYNVDYSDKIMQGTNEFEERTFEVHLGNENIAENSLTEENTQVTSDTETQVNSNIHSDAKEIEMSKEDLIETYNKPILCDLVFYNSFYSGFWSSGLTNKYSIPELRYRELKSSGVENGDIITIHYDEPDLQEKGSQDIGNVLVVYDYIKTVDELNNTEDTIDEQTTMTLLVTSETYENREYILNRIMEKVDKKEEYTIEVEITGHIKDMEKRIVETKTKEY